MTLPFTPKFLKNFEFVLTSNRANRHYKSIHSSGAKNLVKNVGIIDKVILDELKILD